MSRLERLGALALVLAGCASDAEAIIEPTATTPGSFLAIDYGLDHVSLWRVLDVFDPGGGLILIVTVYDVEPLTFPEAADIASEPALPVGTPATFVTLEIVEARPHDVVWFRTLTPEEKARIP